MKCKHHPNREAEHFCTSCGIPICGDCAEQSQTGDYYCFQCAMLHSVSEVGSSLVNKRDKVGEKKTKKKKQWGPFQYFILVSAVLVAVMWGVILFGSEKTPGKKIDFAKQERVFLFMVDSSLKRYAHHMDNKYPEVLPELVPKYLPMQKEDIPELKRLSYIRDPQAGYLLSIAEPKPGAMNIIITPKGIRYESATEGV